jgi:hypothetical protein
MAREAYQGEEFHVTWVTRDDPLWPALADRWSLEIGTSGKPPAAITSKHAKGIGAFFRTEWISQAADRDYYR